jgi:hypothetical protein
MPDDQKVWAMAGFGLYPRLLTRGKQGNIFDIRQGNAIRSREVVNT